MPFDSDRDSAERKAKAKYTFQQLQQDPNLAKAFADQQEKKNKGERARLKKQVDLKQLREKVAKETGAKKDKAMDVSTKMTSEQLQKQAKEKAQAEKEQGTTEQPAQQT